MKVSILIYSFGGGGAERVVSILLKEFCKRYEVELILMNDTLFYAVPDGVKVRFLEKSNPRENGLVKLLKLPILGWKYKSFVVDSDVSISFMSRANYINIFMKIFGGFPKTVVCERTTPSRQYAEGVKGWINRILIKFLYKKADKVVSNSKCNKRDLEKNFSVDNVDYIYNFISDIEFKRQNQDKFTFVSVGRLNSGKNHKMLLEAFSKAKIDANLHIVGDGDLRTELERLSENFGIGERVKFLGRQEDVFSFLNRADCFVFASNYEGFPNVLLEALRSGLPIISTDCRCGPREILAPNSDFTYQLKESIEVAKYGILAPVGDIKRFQEAMKLMFKNRDLREGYRKSSKSRAKDFFVENIIGDWEKLVEDVGQ